ncbi:MAG: leucyl aminopeptidase [Actinomycetota bacterium]|nr:leucyl aminopeptidase [Actinomycetota bacterium]
MTTLRISDKSPADAKADALVIGVSTGPDGPALAAGKGAPDLPRPLRSSLAGSLSGLGITGKADQVVRIPSNGSVGAPVLVLTGLGPAPTGRSAMYDAEVLRRAAGAATRSLSGTSSVAIALPAADAAAIGAIAEGALLGAYAFSRHRARTAKDAKPAVSVVTVLGGNPREKAVRAAAARAEAVGQAVTLTRDLVNTAPGDLPPAALADAVVASLKGTSVKATVLDEKALTKGGYGGILGVGKGSTRPPRLVKLTYRPAKATKHLALIGKGITFDSGGLSLKPPAGMETMKSDMAGAASVAAAIKAIAQLGLPIQVTGWLAIAENMPSGTAQRPSDVMTTYGGRTVEVLNTDAEGRLVLADAVVAASEEQPDLIVDIATLTGHQVVALGLRVSAIMSNDDALSSQIKGAADRTGEQFWPMPLPSELRPSLDSQVADIGNMGAREGGMLVAGLFIKEFVGNRKDSDEQIPWAHLDIAGPSFNTDQPYGYTPKGGTAVGVRTLLALAEDLAAS